MKTPGNLPPSYSKPMKRSKNSIETTHKHPKSKKEKTSRTSLRGEGAIVREVPMWYQKPKYSIQDDLARNQGKNNLRILPRGIELLSDKVILQSLKIARSSNKTLNYYPRGISAPLRNRCTAPSYGKLSNHRLLN